MSPLLKNLRTLTLIRVVHPGHTTVIELQQWWPLLAFSAVLIWHIALPSAVGAMALAALGGMLLWGFVWARALALNVTAKRALRYAAMQVGDEMEEHITLENNSVFPALWAEFVDHSNLPGYHLSSVRGCDGRSALHWREHTLCTQRGVFSLGPWELRLGDPFGFFCVRQTYLQPQEVVVYPSLAALPAQFLPRLSALGEHRRLRQPLASETTNALSTRAHQPGDPLRRIHWPTTARHDSPFTKIFEPEATSTVWLIPDFDPRGQIGEGNDSTEETLVLIAASLAAQFLQRRLAVGLLAAHGETVRVAPPRTGPAHLWDILRALAPLHPAPSTLPLAQLIAQTQALVTHHALLIPLTATLDGAWPRALLHATHRGAQAEAILLDPESFGGAGSAAAFSLSLAQSGLRARTVRRGEVQPVTAAYGAVRRWEFMALGTGRAVALQTPRDVPSLETQLASIRAMKEGAA